VHDGDMIEVDVETRTLRLCVADAELERRRAAWTPPALASDWEYTKMYIDHVPQADRGSDLDFLVGKSGAPVPRDNR
jgi:L-arabonate dehydrase